MSVSTSGQTKLWIELNLKIRHEHVPEDPSAEPEVSFQPPYTAEVCNGWHEFIIKKLYIEKLKENIRD